MQGEAMQFEFATAARIRFGPGVFQEAGKQAAALGRRALVATGGSRERAEPLVEQLANEGIVAVLFPVEGEPQVATVEQATRLAQEEGCDLVIGFGGGSAVDTAKALERPSLPCIAVPTTAGTGSEVTRNAVIGSPEHRVKVSLRSPTMLPRAALVDPELTYSLPPEVTAYTGLDALTQLIEPYVSWAANPLTSALCREGIGRSARSLRTAYAHGDDPAAREDLALASLFGGLALANAKLGAVHGFAGPIGGMVDAPHGSICARLLPLVMEANIRALRARQPESPALARYAEVARLLTGKADAGPEDGAAWTRDLVQELRIPPLSSYGLQASDLEELVEKSARASSMQGNPVALTAEERQEILSRAL
jgi:alcohol dehydrogenase class IV